MAKTQTQTGNRNQQKMAQSAQTGGAVSVLEPPRLPYHPVYEQRYGISGMMWRALVEAVYPSAKTPEGIILAVSYCQSKGYDVMKKMVHVVPIWNSALKKEVEGVWEAVSALRATAFRTGEYMGCDETKFGPMKTFHFDDTVGWQENAQRVQMDVEMPEWAQMTVYRSIKGVRCAFPGPRVYYIGAYGCKGKSEIPNEKWGTSGDSYMLEKCAEAAALRKAFPEELGGVNAAEEMEGRKINLPAGPTIDHDEPAPPRPTRQTVQASEQQAQELKDAEARANGRIPDEPEHDAETGEIIDDSEPQPEAEKAKDPEPEQAQPEATVQAEPEKPAHDYQPLANKMIEGIRQCGSLSTLKGFEKKIAADLDLLRTDAKEQYEQVTSAIEQKKQWFARP